MRLRGLGCIGVPKTALGYNRSANGSSFFGRYSHDISRGFGVRGLQSGEQRDPIQNANGTLNDEVLPGYEKDLENEEFAPYLDDFFERTKLSLPVLKTYKIGARFNPHCGTPQLVIPYFSQRSYERIKDDFVHCRFYDLITKEETKPESHLLGGDYPRCLFGLQSIPSKDKIKVIDQVVVTSTELDAMAVYQATGIPALALPLGDSDNLVLHTVKILESSRFKQVFLWFGDLDKYESRAKVFTEKIIGSVGHKKLKVINEVNRKLSPLKLISQSPKEFASYFDTASQAEEQENYYWLSEAEDRMLLLQEKPQDFGRHFSSIPGLTSALGGFRNGELTVYTGPTGSGKTTLLSQIVLDLAVESGCRSLWFSLELPPLRLLEIKSLQYGLRPNPLHERIDPDDRKESYSQAVIDQELKKSFRNFTQLPLMIARTEKGINLHKLLTIAKDTVAKEGAQHIVIDNLQFMYGGENRGSGTFTTQIDKFMAMDNCITELRQFATDHNVHISLVIHPRKEPDEQKLGIASVGGSCKSTQESDNIIILQRVLGRGEQRDIDLKKNRDNGTLTTIRVEYDRVSRRYTDLSFAATKLRTQGVLLRKHLGEFTDEDEKEHNSQF